jgi:hypothetical protein
LDPLDSNSWLSGFIDTDGHLGIHPILNCGKGFSIKGFTNNPKLYPGFIFYLCQREIDKSGESFRPLFKNIADWLKVSLILRQINGFPQFNITTSNTISNDILIAYLTSYPLFTSKYLGGVKLYGLVTRLELS